MERTEGIYPLLMTPEILSDGTHFSARSWTDGQHVRFYRGLPKKMGGYKEIINSLDEIPRAIMVMPNFPYFRIIIGVASGLKYVDIDSDGVSITVVKDVTLPDFTYNADNTWDFDVMFDSENEENILIANVTTNLSAIDSTAEGLIYSTYQDPITGDFVPASKVTVSEGGDDAVASGGVVALHPYLFYFGNDGKIAWTSENNPNEAVDDYRPTPNKIICGLPTRAGNSSPAGLFWSLDCLIRVTHTGTRNTDFTFDSISCESSILSSKCVIEYDGTFYWCGVDRFLQYNGVIKELPNSTNSNYFFSNINMAQRQKVWVTKNTRWGEIAWHFPIGDDEECSRTVVYSVREQKWLRNSISRGAGEFDHTFSYPIFAGNSLNSVGKYSLWMHEVGLNKQVLDGLGGYTSTAILSYIVSGSIAWCAFDPNMQRKGLNRYVMLTRIELDMIQVGDMTITVGGVEFARSTPEEVQYTITDDQIVLDLEEQRREMYLIFSSNEIDGDFEMGQILMSMSIGDGR